MASDWFWKTWYSLQNFWHFRSVIWRWRGWDFAYSYDLFVRALELQALHIKRCQNHEDWPVDVAQLRKVVAAWAEFQDADLDRHDKFPKSVEDHMADEQRCWDEFHDMCKEHGRGWWD